MLLAHQGGWDEILAVGAPMAVFGSLLLVARRRARAHNKNRQAEAGPTEVNRPEINND
ncbi:MAG: hypothetical protein OXF75_12400 [Acidimicrobiaceae bacterium]|nr:hypothetical protein [Acidimicrobiaceae bacterium]